MGNTYVKLKDYQSAINSYSRAIEIDNKLPEAYFNRGITYILMKEINKGLADLSQAGEMGLYQAYNLIKKYSQK
jgi:tetratricopeptide (TPR) repeat protein